MNIRKQPLDSVDDFLKTFEDPTLAKMLEVDIDPSEARIGTDVVGGMALRFLTGTEHLSPEVAVVLVDFLIRSKLDDTSRHSLTPDGCQVLADILGASPGSANPLYPDRINTELMSKRLLDGVKSIESPSS